MIHKIASEGPFTEDGREYITYALGSEDPVMLLDGFKRAMYAVCWKAKLVEWRQLPTMTKDEYGFAMHARLAVTR